MTKQRFFRRDHKKKVFLLNVDSFRVMTRKRYFAYAHKKPPSWCNVNSFRVTAENGFSQVITKKLGPQKNIIFALIVFEF